MGKPDIEDANFEKVEYNKSGQLIQKVESNLNSKSSSGFANFLSRFNPLGQIGDAVSKILDYRCEIKRLEIEEIRIEKEYQIRIEQGKIVEKIAMEQLKERRMTIEFQFQVTMKSLENIHYHRSEISKTITELSKGITDKNISIEEKQIIRETLKDFTNYSVKLGEEGTANLKQIAESTQKALEQIPSAKDILKLGSGGN